MTYIDFVRAQGRTLCSPFYYSYVFRENTRFPVPALQRGNAYHTGFYAGERKPDERQQLQSVNQV